MKDKVFIRKASVLDTQAVYNLLLIIADLHKKGRPEMFPDLVSKYTVGEVKERLSKEDSGVFVAELDGNTVGYVFCDVITEGAVQTLYIDDLCVDEKKRGKHIGKKLFEAAIKLAKENNCYNLTLNVWSCNSSAMRFYEAQGLVPQKVGMELVL